MNDFVALPFQVPQAQDLLHHAFSNRPNIITNSPESIPHIIRMAPPDPLPADPRVLAAAVPRSKNWPWYQESIGDKLTPTVRVLLEDYSGIPSEDVESHVYQIVCTNMRSSPRCDYTFLHTVKHRLADYITPLIHQYGSGAAGMSMAIRLPISQHRGVL